MKKTIIIIIIICILISFFLFFVFYFKAFKAEDSNSLNIAENELDKIQNVAQNTVSNSQDEISREEISIEKLSLGIDVSQFNTFGQTSPEDPIDITTFSKFILDNKFEYVYIRLGGRGWGSQGNMYYDSKVDEYCNICETLKIPYGFYFLDEALNDDEIIGEINFVKAYLSNKNYKMNLLPLALDLEYQYRKGRSDNSWDTRVPILNKLVSSFLENGINTIIYANGARIETYLKSANCKFWVAMYPEDDKLQDISYKNFVNIEQKHFLENPDSITTSCLNTDLNKCGTETTSYSKEFLDKVVGCQFSQNGASSDGIAYHIDLSVFDYDYLNTFINLLD